MQWAKWPLNKWHRGQQTEDACQKLSGATVLTAHIWTVQAFRGKMVLGDHSGDSNSTQSMKSITIAWKLSDMGRAQSANQEA